MTTKPQSVRSQRSFQEHMKTIYQNIDTLVYAGEVACHNEKGYTNCYGCAFYRGCIVGSNKCDKLRDIIGEHFPQSDIKEVELTKE